MRDLVEYLKEVNTGKDVFYDDRGFATYQINGEECYIMDIYVKPEHREGRVASYYADEIAKIAKENNCTYLTGSVVPSARNSTKSLKVLLGYGFELSYSVENFIAFKKEL